MSNNLEANLIVVELKIKEENDVFRYQCNVYGVNEATEDEVRCGEMVLNVIYRIFGRGGDDMPAEKISVGSNRMPDDGNGGMLH